MKQGQDLYDVYAQMSHAINPYGDRRACDILSEL